MKTPSFLHKAPIDIPNRSGFNMSFENMFTGRTGTLMPALCKFLVPNETVDLGVMFEAELPPMASNFFGRVDMVFEAFFVPCSLLWAGFEDFATHPTDSPLFPAGTLAAAKPTNIPQIVIRNGGTAEKYLGRGTLGDMLGFKTSKPNSTWDDYMSWNTDQHGQRKIELNSLPFLAYHRIYHDYYRNNIVQAPVFVPAPYNINLLGPSPNLDGAAYAPYLSMVYASASTAVAPDGENVTNFSDSITSPSNSFPCGLTTDRLGDGVRLCDLRQRNWSLDYFTAATPQPQAGGAASITFDVATDENGDGTGSISIRSIREANAIQKWLERNNFAGYDYADQTKAQYGCYPDTAKLRKSLYLGRYTQPVYNRSVMQQSQTENTSRNPFGGIAAKFASSQSNGNGTLFEGFRATCHGYLMVMCSLRPQSYYSTGSNPANNMKFIGDVPFPLLSTVGDQPIYNRELIGVGSTDQETDPYHIFGYIDRYAHHKTSLDEVHGLLTDDEQLAPFVLQRSFGGSQEIGSEFLEIPENYLDQVKEVGSDLVPVDYWISCYFRFAKISPLPEFSVPTLGNLENTHKEYIRKGGSKLA